MNHQHVLGKHIRSHPPSNQAALVWDILRTEGTNHTAPVVCHILDIFQAGLGRPYPLWRGDESIRLHGLTILEHRR